MANSDAVSGTFEFADRVYICDGCGSMQPGDDKPCPDCGRDLFTWAGFLGRSDRFRVGSGELPKRWRDVCVHPRRVPDESGAFTKCVDCGAWQRV